MYYRAYRTHPHKYMHRNVNDFVQYSNVSSMNKCSNVIDKISCIKNNNIYRTVGLLTVGLLGGYTIKSIFHTR